MLTPNQIRKLDRKPNQSFTILLIKPNHCTYDVLYITFPQIMIQVVIVDYAK